MKKQKKGVKIEYEGEKMLKIKNRIKKKKIKKMRIGGGESAPRKRLEKDSFSARSFPPCTILNDIKAEEGSLFRLYLQGKGMQGIKPPSNPILNYTKGGKKC